MRFGPHQINIGIGPDTTLDTVYPRYFCMDFGKFLLGDLLCSNDYCSRPIISYLNGPSGFFSVVSKIDTVRVISWFLAMVTHCDEDRFVPEWCQ